MVGQQAAGIRWLHVHPEYLADEDCWHLVRLAREWRDGRLPEGGGVQDQSAYTAAAIDIIHAAWGKLLTAQSKMED
jgi:hypothetical protein